MNDSAKVITASYLLSLLAIIVSLAVWLPATNNLTLYAFFPLLGLIAFGLMWAHYVSDAIRRLRNVPSEDLGTYFKVTSAVVLVCLLLHPGILQLQLFLDGLGPPPFSIFSVYVSLGERIAIICGMIALLAFVAYEFHRLYSTRTWWRYVRWANILAMYLIVWHGLTLGGGLASGWSSLLWVTYALTLTISVLYTRYDKRRRPDESD